jgi:hypothetical protein
LHTAWVLPKWPSIYGRPLAFFTIEYAKLDNNGQRLVEPFFITPGDTSNSRYPDLLVDQEGMVHCVFDDNRTRTKDYQVFYTMLTNAGQKLIEDIVASSSPQNSWYPCITVDFFHNLHIVWYEDAFGLTDEIYYAKINSQGKILVPRTRIDQSNSKVETPRILIDRSNKIHVVWADKRNGHWDIYYRYCQLLTSEAEEETEKSKNQTVSFTLSHSYPNPFNSQTQINYFMPYDAHVKIEIFDLSGKSVNLLVDQDESMGSHRAFWNSNDFSGRPMSSGIYWCRLVAQNNATSHFNGSLHIDAIKIVLLR